MAAAGFGEAWTSASWLQLAGLLVSATLPCPTLPCLFFLSFFLLKLTLLYRPPDPTRPTRPLSIALPLPLRQTLFLGTAIYNGSVLLFDDAQQDGADPAAGKGQGQGQGQGESQALVQKSGGAAAAAAAAPGHEGPGGIIRTAPHMSSPYLAR